MMMNVAMMSTTAQQSDVCRIRHEPKLRERVHRRNRRHDIQRRGVTTEGNESSGGRLSQNPTSMTKFVAEALLPTRQGLFRLRGYRHTLDNWKTFSEPTAIINGDLEGSTEVIVRVHDACFTSEVLGSMKCDCAEQLEMALGYIQDNPPGVIIYLQQEGRGIGLANKIAAYALQDSGLDTVEANRALGFPDDCREYTSVPRILDDLGVRSTKIMTNNPRKVRILKEIGVNVIGRIPCLVQPGMHNKKYLEVKQKKMEHMLEGSWCFWDHNGELTEPSVGRPQGNASRFGDIIQDIDDRDQTE